MLEESLNKLNNWENLKNSKVITAQQFLTPQTACGLRVTLQSMIDITTYLCNKYHFSQVLSGCINQDALEVCLNNFRSIN